MPDADEAGGIRPDENKTRMQRPFDLSILVYVGIFIILHLFCSFAVAIHVPLIIC